MLRTKADFTGDVLGPMPDTLWTLSGPAVLLLAMREVCRPPPPAASCDSFLDLIKQDWNPALSDPQSPLLEGVQSGIASGKAIRGTEGNVPYDAGNPLFGILPRPGSIGVVIDIVCNILFTLK